MGTTILEVTERSGVTHEYHRKPGYSIVVSYRSDLTPDPVTGVTYLTRLERRGDDSPLVMTCDSYPLSRSDIWEEIVSR